MVMRHQVKQLESSAPMISAPFSLSSESSLKVCVSMVGVANARIGEYLVRMNRTRSSVDCSRARVTALPERIRASLSTRRHTT